MGKHSVFEALTSDRAINRICTSEIFSSEKFIFYSRILNQKECLLKKSLGTGYHS